MLFCHEIASFRPYLRLVEYIRKSDKSQEWRAVFDRHLWRNPLIDNYFPGRSSRALHTTNPQCIHRPAKLAFGHQFLDAQLLVSAFIKPIDGIARQGDVSLRIYELRRGGEIHFEH